MTDLRVGHFYYERSGNVTVPKINSAHGSDTRNIINRAIEVLNQQGKTIQDLVAEGQLTEEQYAELITIINSNLKSGEVGEYDLTPELRSEVDKVKNKIDAGDVTENDITGELKTLIDTIPNKINHGNVSVEDIDKNKGLLDSTFFTSEFLSELNDGVISSTEVLPGSLTTEKYARSSVTIEKTNFLEVASNNLFNNLDVLVNSRLSNSGNIQSYSNGNLSHFIPVTPNTEYTMNRAFQYAYYTIKREFISLHDGDVITTVTIPDNVYYLRTVTLHSNMDRARVNIGSELLPYDEYAIKLKGSSEITLDMFEENLQTELSGILGVMTEENESWVI